MKTPYKTAKVVRPYSVLFNGWNMTVPAGATVSNQTACGNNDAYRFWIDYQSQARELTGFPSSVLSHDLMHYGINVPADHCTPYPTTS